MFELGIIIVVVLAAWAYIKMSKEKAEENAPVKIVEEPVVIESPDEEDTPVETVEESAVIESPVEEDAPVETVEESAVIESPAEEVITSESGSHTVADVPNAAIPEDSMLKRHYLQHLAAKESVQANHHTMRLPEDVVLKRHFIQKITADIAEQLADRPTDSTLVRHYDAQLASLVEQQLQELE